MRHLVAIHGPIKLVTANDRIKISSYFTFSKDPAERRVWCNDIKQQNGRDGFKVTNNTVVYSKHFENSKIYRPPGGTKQRLIENVRPVWHEWNNFEKKDAERKRKPPTCRELFRLKQSPQKRSKFPKSFTTRENANLSRPILEQERKMVV